MQSVAIIIFCCVYYVVAVTAQTQNTVSSDLQPKSNWQEAITSHQAFKDKAKSKSIKLSCVLSLLKNALSEELQISQLLKEDAAQDSLLSSMKSIIEEKQSLEKSENQIERPNLRNENESNPEHASYQNVMTQMQSTFPMTQNASNDENNIEMPTMIPIFKPRPQTIPRKESNQNIGDFSSKHAISRQIPKSKAISFLPEKIIQTNMSPIPSTSTFNIPCQRAADVLDMSIVPKKAVCSNVNTNPKVNSSPEAIKPNIRKQLLAPVTVSCADEDDTIAMLFKPKNISLKQAYGNLLKKITITVLVPYHMSKLGEK